MGFEAAKCLLGRLALGPLLGEVGLRRRVNTGLGQDDDVQRRIQLSVAKAR